MQRWYVPNGHRGHTLLVQTPGRWSVAGVTYVLLSPSPYRRGLTKPAGQTGCGAGDKSVAGHVTDHAPSIPT
jgi:hypothetical protein